MRDSILEITREWNEFKVTERRLSIHEVTKASKEGRILEAFGSGLQLLSALLKNLHTIMKPSRFQSTLNSKQEISLTDFQTQS